MTTLGFFDRVRFKIAQLVWPSKLLTVAGTCANRVWRKGVVGPIEVTVTYRDTRQEDGYSREELLTMLRTVREHEEKMGWRVPEDTDGVAPPIWVEITPKGKVVGTHGEPFSPREDHCVVMYRAVTSRLLRALLQENPHGR